MAKSNAQYWLDRQAQNFLDGEKEALELAKELQENYDRAVNQIQKEINNFYAKFARENNISINEAKKLLDKSELKNFNAQLKEYMEYAKENSFDTAYLNELNLLKYKTKVSRFEELKANIKFQIAKLQKKNYDQIKNTMLRLYDEAFLKEIFTLSQSVGLSIAFARPATAVIEKYLNQTINLANYAIGEKQIWQYKIPQLMNILGVKIPQGITLGQNPKKVAKDVSKTLNTDYNNTVRLIRTEYNYIFNQASIDSYKACGINQYQILVALDERTCDTCGDLDLLIVNYEDKEVGVNFPPFHPNCRCTTKAYFEPDEFDVDNKRIAKDKDGKPYLVPNDLTFNEWKAGLTKHEGGVTYFKSTR